MKTKTKQYAVWAGLLLCSAVVASANTLVTFQVDMTQQITLGTFVPGTSVADVRGTLNNWGNSPGVPGVLTNDPAGANPSLYSGTFIDSTDPDGSTVQYKFHIDLNDNWESPISTGGGNRTATLPAGGGTLVLPVVYFNDAPPVQPVTNNATFQVDMTEQVVLGNFIPGGEVQVRGSFTGWASNPVTLTNDPGGANVNLYTMVVPITDAPGTVEQYKFHFDPGDVWESPISTGGGNRTFNLLTTNGDIVLPVVFFNDLAVIPPVTNDVTFQVDMSAQILGGSYDPNAGGLVEVRGTFNSWSGGTTLTNDTGASNTNLYSTVVNLVTAPGTRTEFKFHYTVPDVWESPVSTGGGNRSFNTPATNGPVALAPVSFSDLSINDLVTVDTLVTFSVNMTNAVGTDSYVFDPSAGDTVWVNGAWVPWWTWGAFPPGDYQMTNNPVGSEIYTLELLIPRGTPLGLTYKFSINGLDNEAPRDANHVRYIRTLGNYVMPLDTFGTQLIEPSFGNLKIGLAAAGSVPITWLGRSGVHLQSRATLTTGTWQDLMATDGLSSTNYPVGPGPMFFRLIKPAY